MPDDLPCYPGLSSRQHSLPTIHPDRALLVLDYQSHPHPAVSHPQNDRNPAVDKVRQQQYKYTSWVTSTPTLLPRLDYAYLYADLPLQAETLFGQMTPYRGDGRTGDWARIFEYRVVHTTFNRLYSVSTLGSLDTLCTLSALLLAKKIVSGSFYKSRKGETDPNTTRALCVFVSPVLTVRLLRRPSCSPG